jgi:hypothetical protein
MFSQKAPEMNKMFHQSARNGSKTVNPRWHDEFAALCALFSTGELTEEEWALLQVHLAYCDSCRLTFHEYQLLADRVLPVMAASVLEDEQEPDPESSSFSLEAAEVKLAKSLVALEVTRMPQSRPKTVRFVSPAIIAAGVAIVASLAVPHLFRLKTPSTESAIVRSASSQTAPQSPATDLRSDLDVAQRKNVELQRQLTATEEQYRKSHLAILSLDQQLKGSQSESHQVSEQREALNQQLALDQTEIRSLRDKLSATTAITAEQSAYSSNLEAKIHELNASLEEKDRTLALDKEFLAHDRDIRDLIGARDLYISEIYDVAQNGKTAKPFGRIFYTKDRSLVFYGYDLDKQPGLKQSVGFQAWGSSDNMQAVSLGMFYQDETHERWVLRFDDTKTLARLNMVFVTAEPKGGSAKPSGKPLLLAYLKVQANHP